LIDDKKVMAAQQGEKFWGIIPAAGVGKRMGLEIPKQYLEIRGKKVLQHTLERLLRVERLTGIVVAIGGEDSYWPHLECARHPKVRTAPGGRERADSVLSALECLGNLAAPRDWVLVHDAARPCITPKDVNRLLDLLQSEPIGGILALPVTDTLKGVATGEIIETIDRSRIWRALTPQMFRYGMLRQSLRSAFEHRQIVTDEASALELQGFHPRIVEGRSDNIKITRPEDLPLAAFYLEQQCYE
jgi:2-C-methyl-D-erythritol 4-phosphate cytidylyltransferase